MSSDRLQENLDAMAEAAGGVSRLRDLILHLAVHGRLAEQNSDDNPAQSIVAKWNITCVDVTGPSVLPANWKWCQVGEAGEVKLGRQRSPDNHQGTHMVPYLRVANVHEARFDLSDVKEMNFTPHEQQIYRLLPKDVLLNEGQSYELVGRPAMYQGEVPNACFQNTLLRFRSRPGVVPEYALVVFRSYMRNGRFRKEAQQTTNIAHLSASRLSSIEFPLPPTSEQERIVAKVDELMALCDELEQKQEQRHLVRRAAHTSALESLTNAQTPDELAHAWQRMQKHWDVLAAHADAVPPLRQAILQLAVQGRLVAQNQDDEPAISLLSQIAGRHAAAMTSTASGQNELYLLPNSWKWARFDAIAAIRSNLVDPAGFREAAHIAPNHIEKGTGRLLPYGSIGDDKVTSGKHRFYAGQILYSKIRPNLSKAALVDFEGLCSADMYPIEPWIDSRYLLTFILSETFLRQVTAEDNRVAMPKVNQEQLSMVRVAVPPLAEQKRIVARVDELMALCDSLEQRAREQEALASQLAHAAVAAVAMG